ncbi:MAG: 50S ribosome-binding GTPase [Phycisphaerales bacterium]|nr:50S ribosome-binding GTPase [Phycisphaerales bacterium]
MRLGDIIVAVASPPGWAARAVIRLSGPGAWAMLSGVLDTAVTQRGCRAARLRFGPSGLPALLLAQAARRSYTGEESAELVLPGSPLLLDRVLRMLAGLPGARLAAPGEFTARAYLAGRMTLEQAEGVAALIAAQGEDERASAADLLGGEAGKRYRDWIEEAATLLALVEAGIDFSDQEDVTGVSTSDLARRVERLLDDLASFAGSRRAREAEAASLPRVILAGAPNAGKSTLANALLGRSRAVVSDQPGTTRDALEEVLDLTGVIPGGSAVLLTDTPGIDDGGGAIHAAAQHAARAALAGADLVVYCDPLGRFAPLPVAAQAELRVRTKADRVAPPESTGLPVCALDGWNLPELRRQIACLATSHRARGLAALLPRHREAMDRAAAHLDGARLLALDDAGAEVIAGELRAALDALGELAGRIDPDRVLGRVFASFCIGK